MCKLFSDTPSETRYFGEEITFNAADFSIDHDLLPQVNQGIQFEWSCRKETEVRLIFFVVLIIIKFLILTLPLAIIFQRSSTIFFITE